MADTFVTDAKTGKKSIVKDPDAVLDYVFLWGDWLDGIGDSLSAHSVAVESGSCVLDSSVISGQNVVAWVSGGTPGETCALRCRVVTAGGRTDDRTAYLKVKER